MHIIALNRCWVIRWRWLAITLIVIVLLLSLAFWQLQRANYKTELLARLARLQSMGAISALQLQGLAAAQADGVQIVTQAYWHAPYVWLLDNQMLQGRIGYDVIVPMQLEVTGNLVLINLGWVAAPVDRTQMPVLDIPEHLNIRGVLRTHLGGFQIGNNTEPNAHWPMRIQRVDPIEFSVLLQQPLYRGIIYQLKNTPYVAHYQPVVMPPERHRAYALQWGLLAVAVIIIALAASLKRADTVIKEPQNVN
jgi:surfeit locus 1 family protein